MSSASSDAPMRILVAGDVCGRFSALYKRIDTLQKKSGLPFDMLLCVGSFFKPFSPAAAALQTRAADQAQAAEGSEAQAAVGEDDEWSQLLKGSLKACVPTYILGPNAANELPYFEGVLDDGAELCHQITYLGRKGILKTPQGLTVAYFGGSFGAGAYTAAHPQSDQLHHYTHHDVEHLLQATKQPDFRGVDIFLTSDWPRYITRGAPLPSIMPATMTDGASGSRADWGRVGSDVISILSSALMPRYHFAGALDVYYERLPYRTAPAVSMGLQQGHATRFLALGTQISPTKQKALYAFTIKPLVKEIKSVLLTHPSETTDSPFADAPLRTPAMGTQQEQAGVSMFYSGLDASGKKRRREDDPTDGQARKVPREGYVCNICQQSGHFIQDCPQKDERDAQRLAQREAERGPYVCRICNVPGHPIQECPERVTRPMDQDGHPRLPDNYVCKLCNVPGHHVRDCPSKQDTPPGANRRPPNAPPAAQGPCWFCLGSPQVEKHLVVSIGTELYMALPKGGLSPQHVLLLPIGHVACSKDLGEEARAEMGRYMSSVRALFAAQGCGMVAFERNVRTPHMQIQLIPVPLALTEQLIPTFQEHARRLNYSFQELAPGEDLTAALPSPDTPYFVVEFDSGVRLLLVVTGRFPLMFGREVLCDPALLNAPNKIDWKQCQESAETETTFASDFKAAFKPFDQTDDL